jgi:hypothetical protein
MDESAILQVGAATGKGHGIMGQPDRCRRGIFMKHRSVTGALVGDPEGIQMGTERISTEKSAWLRPTSESPEQWITPCRPGGTSGEL